MAPREMWLVALAVAGVVLSLGTATPVYGWLSGFAVAWFERRVRPSLVP